MKFRRWMITLPGIGLLGAILGWFVSGYFEDDNLMRIILDRDKQPIAEGVIYSVEYEASDGRTQGFTRLNMKEAIPGGSGSWNVDATGKLFPEFLVISYPQYKDLGPHIIPTHRLMSVRFGDGGIKQVAKIPKP